MTRHAFRTPLFVSSIDNATFAGPVLPSSRIISVLVAGTPVVRDALLVEGVSPGGAIRRDHP